MFPRRRHAPPSTGFVAHETRAEPPARVFRFNPGGTMPQPQVYDKPKSAERLDCVHTTGAHCVHTLARQCPDRLNQVERGCTRNP